MLCISALTRLTTDIYVAICVECLDHRIHHVHAMRPRDQQVSRWAATLAVVLTVEVH